METRMTKRSFLGTAAGALGGLWLTGCSRGEAGPVETFEVTKSPEEWRKILTPAQYSVLREENTERAGSSPLDAEHRRGTFVCAGCALPVYTSEAKFDSGTGWPSFTARYGTRSGPSRTAAYSGPGPKCIVGVAAVISGTSSTTDPPPPASATA
jgi:peptide-methionine (R)-S-oxide reductase